MTNEQDAARAAVLGFPALSEASSLRADDLYNTYTLDLSPVVGHLSCVNNKPTLHNFSMELLDSKYQEATIDFSIRIMPDVEAYVNEPVTWSTFALLRGYCPSESSYFVVTLPDGSTKDLRNGITRDDEGNMLIMVTGLAAGTYQYEIKDDEDENIQTSLESFTIYDPTTGSYIVQNLGFDDWNTITTNKLSFSMGKNYMSPNATTDFTKVYWESGNYGASAIGEVLSQNTSDVATSDQKNTNAAYLKGTFAGLSGIMGAFSAGSVFIGKPTSVSTSGATLDYGRLHNGFPTKLSGYYKYTSGTIDYKKNEKETGGSDKAIIYIALSTRHFDELQSLMGSTIVRFDKTDASIIAYAELVVDKTVSTYTKFELPLIYREGKMPSYSNFVSEDGTPKIYITIVATSSIDGDEFTGSTSSELWIDEFSLDYSYNAESLVGTEYEKYTPVNINEVSVSTDNSGNTEENTENIENTENNETNE